MSTIANLINNTTTTLAALGVKLALVPAIQGKPTATRIDGMTPDWQRAKPILTANRGLLYHSLGLNLGRVYTYGYGQQPDPLLSLANLERARQVLAATIVDIRLSPNGIHRSEWDKEPLSKRFGKEYKTIRHLGWLQIHRDNGPDEYQLFNADVGYPQLFNILIDGPVILLCDCDGPDCHRFVIGTDLSEAGLFVHHLTATDTLEPLYLRYRQAITAMHTLAKIAGDDTELSRLERILDRLDTHYRLQEASEMKAAWKEGMNQE